MPTPAETRVDPFLSEEFHRDPATVIARLREEDPVHQVPGLGVRVATRYDDVRRLFTDENVDNDPRAFEHYRPAPEGSTMRWISENGLFSAPPEQYARQRRWVSAAFTPRAVARMEDQVHEVVEQFAGSLYGRRGVGDLVAEFTGPISNAVIARITGVRSCVAWSTQRWPCCPPARRSSRSRLRGAGWPSSVASRRCRSISVTKPPT